MKLVTQKNLDSITEASELIEITSKMKRLGIGVPKTIEGLDAKDLLVFCLGMRVAVRTIELGVFKPVHIATSATESLASFISDFDEGNDNKEDGE